ncbi:embryonic polarity protein dorsal-like isoform X2 [Eurosta solidaginis]|uniref:embryonic polarity protein dorsal-like isoform X2 n=1 Tax=Eurosta solidaginis TaxID=178769 RepID=UPI0035316E8D
MNHYQAAESYLHRVAIEQSQHTPEQHNAHNRTLKKQQLHEVPAQLVPQETVGQDGSKLGKKFPNAHVKIIEQPASKAIRFRYECERRTAGSIVGVNSTGVLKTYPTIEVVGYKGRGVAVVSCVTKDPPYRPHPYSLTGKEGCRKGVCTVEINSESMRYVFNNLGIQCVRKKDIEEALKLREEIRVDPYKTGFAHRTKVASIDLNALRLCFQVFIEDVKGRFTIPLAPVVSEPILNRNSAAELTITEMCSSGTVLGNTQIMLLCEKVFKDDIAVRFYEEQNGRITWEAFASFLPSDVHKQTSIRLKTPRYHNIYISEEIQVQVQLKRPSDGEVSESWQFTYKPLDTNLALLRRKYTHGKGAGEATQQITQQAPTSNPDISQLMSDTKKILPLNNFAAYTTTGQMTPSPQPASPPAINQSYRNAFTHYNKLINNNTPPKSPHEEIGLANVECVAPTIPTHNLPTTSKTLENFNEYSIYNAYEDAQQLAQATPHTCYATSLGHAQQQPSQQQQSFCGNLYYNANTWDEGYANILRDVNNGNIAAFTAAAINNFYNSNTHFNAQQNALGNAFPAGMQHTHWNFPANQNMQLRQWAHNDQQKQHSQAQQQQQQAQQAYQQSIYEQHATKKIVMNNVLHQ